MKEQIVYVDDSQQWVFKVINIEQNKYSKCFLDFQIYLTPKKSCKPKYSL